MLGMQYAQTFSNLNSMHIIRITVSHYFQSSYKQHKYLSLCYLFNEKIGMRNVINPLSCYGFNCTPVEVITPFDNDPK